jgi:DNA-binding protein H-NS
MKSKIADGEARDRLIIWIRRRMEEFGITIDALAESIQHDKAHPPLYRDARGNEWNGLGDMPHWLQAARNAGVDPDFFRIEVKRTPQEDGTRGECAPQQSDPRQLDLFA